MRFKQVNQSLGRSLSFGSFSGQQAIILASVFCFSFFLTTIVFGFSVYIGLYSGAWAGLTCAILSGSKPHKYWSKLYPSTPLWVKGVARYTQVTSKNRLGNKSVQVTRGSKERLSPIEDYLDLLTLCRIEKDGLVAGAYVLGKGNDLTKITIKFGFSCSGIAPLQRSQEEFEVINKTIEAGFKEITDSTFTFRTSTFCDYSDARISLQERLEKAVSSESEYLDNATMARIQELSRQRQRKQVRLDVYSTYSPQVEQKDLTDRFLDSFKVFWQRKIENKGKLVTEQKLTTLLNQAFNAALRHYQILQDMGLKPVFKTETELWDDLSRQIGANKLNGPPVLVLNSTGLREELAGESQYTKAITSVIGDEIHATSKLLQNGVPFADRSFVCIPSKGSKKKYVGVLVLAEKPEGFWGEKGQLQYLWQVFAKDSIFDVEVITEITPADSNLVRVAQQMLTRNALSRDLQARERKTVEVSAQINTERSLDAQRLLYTGDKPFHTSVVVLVYRDTLEELAESCRHLSNLIKQPAYLERETEYTWLIWLQTLGIRKEALLSTPYYRRLLFFASELSGVTNLVKVAEADKAGVELIAGESGDPIKIDLSKPKNLLILGTTGSGKSVLVASLISECLSLGMSFLIIDLPNGDGSGTFGDFTPFFNGFYFDISRQSNNLLQLPDLTGISSAEKQEREKSHRNDVNLVVSQLVLGSQSFDSFLVQTIESLIPLGVKAFYEDQGIKQRFTASQESGLNSEAWDKTPTLVDLVQFYAPEHINLDYKDENVEKALNYIRLRLKYWLSSSLSGAIARPSSFDTSSKLITFALTNLQSNEEAELLGLSAYIAASRQSLSCTNSALFMDEASVLLRFPSLSRLIGRKCATARKEGMRIILAGQDIVSIAESEAGEQILQNMPLRLVGRIVPGATSSYLQHLGIPEDIIKQNESFEPNMGYTKWLLNYNNTYTSCRYYPSYPLLALTANSREEQAERDSFKAKFPNKFDWLSEYWRYYKNNIRR